MSRRKKGQVPRLASIKHGIDFYITVLFVFNECPPFLNDGRTFSGRLSYAVGGVTQRPSTRDFVRTPVFAGAQTADSPPLGGLRAIRERIAGSCPERIA